MTVFSRQIWRQKISQRSFISQWGFSFNIAHDKFCLVIVGHRLYEFTEPYFSLVYKYSTSFMCLGHFKHRAFLFWKFWAGRAILVNFLNIFEIFIRLFSLVDDTRMSSVAKIDAPKGQKEMQGVWSECLLTGAPPEMQALLSEGLYEVGSVRVLCHSNSHPVGLLGGTGFEEQALR
jgi:hypothetical protein